MFGLSRPHERVGLIPTGGQREGFMCNTYANDRALGLFFRDESLVRGRETPANTRLVTEKITPSSVLGMGVAPAIFTPTLRWGQPNYQVCGSCCVLASVEARVAAPHLNSTPGVLMYRPLGILAQATIEDSLRTVVTGVRTGSVPRVNR